MQIYRVFKRLRIKQTCSDKIVLYNFENNPRESQSWNCSEWSWAFDAQSNFLQKSIYRNKIFEANPWNILGKQHQNDCSNRSQEKWKISTALLLTKYIAKSCTNTWVKIFLGCSCTTDFRKCTPYFIVDCLFSLIVFWLFRILQRHIR